jgi:hypothetical protein
METITILISYILAVSLASERLVTIIKTLLPEWLADEKKTAAQEVDLVRDRWRRIRVILLAFLSAYVTSSLLVGNFNPFLDVRIIDGHPLPLIVLAFLASGGSAFWSNLLGYTKAVKDIRVQRRAQENLQYHEEAKSFGLKAYDGGMAVRKKIMTGIPAELQLSLSKISALSQPSFNDNINQLLQHNRI